MGAIRDGFHPFSEKLDCPLAGKFREAARPCSAPATSELAEPPQDCAAPFVGDLLFRRSIQACLIPHFLQ